MRSSDDGRDKNNFLWAELRSNPAGTGCTVLWHTPICLCRRGYGCSRRDVACEDYHVEVVLNEANAHTCMCVCVCGCMFVWSPPPQVAVGRHETLRRRARGSALLVLENQQSESEDVFSFSFCFQRSLLIAFFESRRSLAMRAFLYPSFFTFMMSSLRILSASMAA